MGASSTARYLEMMEVETQSIYQSPEYLCIYLFQRYYKYTLLIYFVYFVEVSLLLKYVLLLGLRLLGSELRHPTL